MCDTPLVREILLRMLDGPTLQKVALRKTSGKGESAPS